MKKLVLHASPFEVKSLNCRLDLPCKIMSLVTTCFVFVACDDVLFAEMHKARMNIWSAFNKRVTLDSSTDLIWAMC